MTEIISILFIAFATASFSNFFDDCLQDGMILAKWGALAKDKFWMKPLGGCLICTNTWVNIITATAIAVSLHIEPISSVILTGTLVSISNTFLKFIIK